MENDASVQAVLSRVVPIEEFLWRELEAGHCTLPWKEPAAAIDVLFHVHCHQRALDNGRATMSLLQRIPGARVRESGAGCCGMAGSFGYEKEHYDLSVQIAEDRLLPALRTCSDSARVVTAGFSCRHQIRDLAGREAQHPLELIDEFLAGPR